MQINQSTTDAFDREIDAILDEMAIEIGMMRAHHPRPVSPEVRRFAQEQRAIADAELAARGVDLKAKLAAAISEYEAA